MIYQQNEEYIIKMIESTKNKNMEVKKYTTTNKQEIVDWGIVDGKKHIVPSPVLEPSEEYLDGRYLQVNTPEGIKPAILGDCIIKDNGVFEVYNVLSKIDLCYENPLNSFTDEQLVDEICNREVNTHLADKLFEKLDAYGDLTKLIDKIDDNSHELTLSNRKDLKQLCFSDYNEDEWFSPSNLREEMLIEKLARTYKKIHPDVLEHFLDFYE